MTADAASEYLGVSKGFLYNIASKLITSGVIKGTKGPGGGYELIGEPRVIDVFQGLSKIRLLTQSEKRSYRVGRLEHRTLEHVANNLSNCMVPFLMRKIRNVVKEVVANEMTLMDNIVIESGTWEN